MSPGDYILVAAALGGLALWLAVMTSKPKKPKSLKETSRWKRFRLRPGPLHGDLGKATRVVAEDPKGLKLLAEPRVGDGRVRLAGSCGKPRIEVRRRWSPFRKRFSVCIQKTPWFQLRIPRSGPARVRLDCTAQAGPFELRGSISEREYEILKYGRLAATVSWQGGPESNEDEPEYIVETIKTEDPVPLISLAVSVEVALAGGD